MKVGYRVLAIIAVLISIAATPAWSAQDDQFSTEPRTNDGRKWRIAYYEGGAYRTYQQVLIATVRGLMDLGWIEPATIPKQSGEQTRDLWTWLGRHLNSDYIEFVSDAHYSAKWDDDTRKELSTALTRRLNETDEIDLLIAMGTWAGKDFANNKHTTPTMVLSTSDPLSSGIIKSVEDSGYAHVHALVDPTRFERQIKVFHEIVGFKKLGVAYEDTVDGRSYAAIDVIERLSKERGFELIRCYTKSDVSDGREAEKSVIACFDELVEEADAIYVTEQGGVTNRSIPLLVDAANDSHIPTFSQSGSDEVRYGFLASLSRAGFKYVGEFNARSFAKVFNGAMPNQLNQLFEQPPKIALNLKTAEVIGFDPPIVLLGAADEIFHEIQLPD